MATDQSTGADLFKNLRVGREAVALLRSITALAFLFDRWSRSPEKRELTYEEPESGHLRVIAFTKLGRHFCAVWDKLFKPYADKLKNILEHGIVHDLTDLVTFPSPWVEISGPHGRQPGRYESTKGSPIYLIEILFELQKKGYLQYFQIIPPKEHPDEPAHYKTIVKPGMEDPDDDHFLRGFTRKEIEILKDWKYSLRHLDGTAIRALGTHVNSRETIADIRYEFVKGIPLCEHIARGLSDSCCFLDNSYNLSRFSREANLKSRKNSNVYMIARKHMVDSTRKDELRRAFEKSHKGFSEIWETEDMSYIATVSRKAWAIARYFECVAYFRNNIGARTQPNSKKDRYFNHKWNDCCAEIMICRIQSLPTQIREVFEHSHGDVRADIRQTMIQVIADLKGEMKQLVRRYGYA